MATFLRHLYRRAIDATHRGGSFRGVYRNFDEAVRSVPKIKPVGYNHAELGNWYQDKIRRIADDDYPALFWLSHALKDSRSVFEIGGHVGVAYHAFSQYLKYPQELSWQIWDVPAIAEAGRKLAVEMGTPNVSFTSTPTESTGADILFAAGSLQYIDSPAIHEVIANFRHKPKHIIINKTPVWDGDTFITLQSIGFSCCPYIVRNRMETISAIERQGYQLRDTWTKTRHLQVRFHPGKTIKHYTGFYFCR